MARLVSCLYRYKIGRALEQAVHNFYRHFAYTRIHPEKSLKPYLVENVWSSFHNYLYYLLQLFDQAAQTYQEITSNINSAKIDVTIQEGRLTWLVYIIGSAVGGRVSFNSNDEHDAMDGELVCR